MLQLVTFGHRDRACQVISRLCDILFTLADGQRKPLLPQYLDPRPRSSLPELLVHPASCPKKGLFGRLRKVETYGLERSALGHVDIYLNQIEIAAT